MKTGLSIEEMVRKLDNEARRRVDVKTDSNNVSFFLSDVSNGKQELKAMLDPTGEKDYDNLMALDITPTAYSQLVTKLGVPKRYADMLKVKHPELLRYDLSYLCANNKDRFMLRTLKDEENKANVGTSGKLRAVLSDKYRRIDNFDLLREAIIPVIESSDGLGIESCEITDDHFYIKTTTAKKTFDLRQGDPVQVGFMVKNSETGKSSLRVSMFINRLVCMNGMIAADTLRKYHVGRAEEDNTIDVFRDETLRQDDKAFFMKVKDVMSQVQDDVRVQDTLNKFRETMKVDIVKPSAAIENIGTEFSLNEEEKENILETLLKNSHRDGLSMFGLVNAVTAAAEKAEDYDRATELEQLGGILINLPTARQLQLVAA